MWAFTQWTHHSCRYSKCEEPGTLALNTMRQLKLPAPFLHLPTPRAHEMVITIQWPPCQCASCAHAHVVRHESTLIREKRETRALNSALQPACPPQPCHHRDGICWHDTNEPDLRCVSVFCDSQPSIHSLAYRSDMPVSSSPATTLRVFHTTTRTCDRQYTA